MDGFEKREYKRHENICAYVIAYESRNVANADRKSRILEKEKYML